MEGNGFESDDALFADSLLVSPPPPPPLLLPPPSNPTTQDDNDDHTDFEFVLSDVGNRLAKGEYVASDWFYTKKFNHGWRLGVHLAGFGNGKTDYISCYLEMMSPSDNNMTKAWPGAVREKALRKAKFILDIRDVYGSVVSKAHSQSTRSHTCGIKAEAEFNSHNAKDAGFERFYAKKLFKSKCITGQSEAVFLCRIWEEDALEDNSVEGMVGLENQGATCYLNSLIQTLFHLPELCRNVYAIDTSLDVSQEGVVLEIQHVFADLQQATKAANTEKLTKAFGWTDSMVFIQHDVQEMLRELLDKLEARILLGDKENKIIAQLFSAKYETFVKCAGGFTSSRVEEFFDVSLDVLGFQTIMESFESYCKEEELNGENQYEAPQEHGGKQDAIKGVRFCSFPPILHLHLKRFAYNYDLDKPYKIHDRFEFTEELDLNRFVVPNETMEATGMDYTYKLHSVLVHSGNDQRGHYYVYICIHNQWYKFNDELVTKVKRKEAMDDAFGDGEQQQAVSPKRWRSDFSASAYMLVYIRKSMWDVLMQPIINVPQQLLMRFTRQAELKRSKQTELDRIKFNGKIKIATLVNFASFTHYSPEKQMDSVTFAPIQDFVDWSQVLELDVGDIRYTNTALLYANVRKAMNIDSTMEFTLWDVSVETHGSARARKLVPNCDDLMVRKALECNRLFLDLSQSVSSQQRLDGELAFFFRRYDPATATVSDGWFISDTGLFHKVNTRRDMYEMFRTRVLTQEERNNGEEYELYELFDLKPNTHCSFDNVELVQCDDEVLDPETTSEAGDIFLFTRKARPKERTVQEVFEQLTYQSKLTIHRVNTTQSWELVTGKNLCLQEAICVPLAEMLSLDSNCVAILTPHTISPLLDDSMYLVRKLMRILLTQTIKKQPTPVYLPRGQVTVEFLPFSRAQVQDGFALHLVVHLPEPQSLSSSPVELPTFRNDTPTAVGVFLSQQDDVCFTTVYERVIQTLGRQGNEKLVLLAVTDSTPAVVVDEDGFTLALGSSNQLPWQVLDFQGQIVLSNLTAETRWFGELVPEAESQWLVSVVHCSSIMHYLGEDCAVAIGLPTICPLIEGDTLGRFWKRLVSRLCLSAGSKTSWRPLVIADREAIYLDQKEASPGGDMGSASSSAIKRSPTIPEANFDALPLWLHASFERFVETKDVFHLPTLYLLHPPVKPSAQSQSLTIRST
ncbi:hypothetical protein BASA81_001701 [Batrachochytrium salamandrivorans]|nr:hypothetical protein BASA81_001701 [Batrachochytrium salamandrivorans]